MTLKNLISPEERRKKLKELLKKGRIIRGIEAHNAISALIANDLQEETDKEGYKKINEFDFFWESSFTDSASKGYPDIEVVSFDSRLKTISEILEVTNKPMIVDGDTGGDIHHFEYLVPKLERMGISAIIIEDKVFPKRNSLDAGSSQEQEDPERFSEKIKVGKKVQSSEDFMIIVRIESLINGRDVDDAITRARHYIKAGADGIMIHSKSEDPKEIFEFAQKYKKLCEELNITKPLVSIPTTYNSVYEEDLEKKGFDIVIYANHLLRASYNIMEKVGKIILKNERSLESDPYITPVKEIFDKVGFYDIKEKDRLLNKPLPVIIPSAGEYEEFKHLFGDLPRSLIKINEKRILEYQVDILKKLGLHDINVIIGYQKDKFDVEGVNYFENTEYSSTGMIHSLMHAKEKMNEGFVFLSADILFDERLIKELLRRKEDIIIVLDNSYLYPNLNSQENSELGYKYCPNKRLDAVITRYGKQPKYQTLRNLQDEVILINENISKENMTHEFAGIIKFSKEGAKNFIKVFEDCKMNHKGKFHASENFSNATDMDMIQEMINRGFKVSIHETNGGWLEINNEDDLNYAKEMLNQFF